jgi:hypothetical protein
MLHTPKIHTFVVKLDNDSLSPFFCTHVVELRTKKDVSYLRMHKLHFFKFFFTMSWAFLIFIDIFYFILLCIFFLVFLFVSHELWLTSTQIVGAFNVIAFMFALGNLWLLFIICFTQITKLSFVFNVSCELQPTFLFYFNSLLFILSIIVVHVCVFTQLFFLFFVYMNMFGFCNEKFKVLFLWFSWFSLYFLLYTFDVIVDVDFLLSLSSLNTTTNNITNFFVLYNHPICDYMWLFDICNNVLLFLQLFTIFLNFLLIFVIMVQL